MNLSKMISGPGRAGALSALTLVASAAGAAPAAAQSNPLNSIVGCDVPGQKQGQTAILGGLLGAAAGAAVAKHDGQGAVIGGLLGAAAGSYFGCQKQREQAQGAPYAYDQAYGYGYGDYGRNYDDRYDRGYQPAYGGAPLARGVQRSAFVPTQQQFVATTNVNLRAGPTTASARVGQLYAGQAFEALGSVRGSNWILVGRNGVGVGYVSQAYVRPAGSDRYAYGYRR
jgi:uncharacterized protein YgiM (DUF1202 family)